MNRPPSAALPRRDFLRGIMTAAAATSLAGWPARGRAQEAKGEAPGGLPPGERVNLACCGIGNRGADVINGLYATGLANVDFSRRQTG